METKIMSEVGMAEWDALWGRVKLTFSEEDEERYEKLCGVRARNFAKHKLDMAPLDERGLRLAMVEYSKTMRYQESLGRYGITAVDMQIAEKYCPEVMMTMAFIRKMRDTAMDMRRSDNVQKWEDALDEKATDREGLSKADTKAAMFLLGHVDRRVYGDEPAKVDVEQQKLAGGGIQVNVIGDAALKLLRPPEAGDAKRGGVFIDV